MDFTYADQTTEQRVWTLIKTGSDTWVGTADGVLGVARGLEGADNFNWTYKIDLSVPGGTLTLNFNDWMWMWMIDERHILNFALMKKVGVNIGKEVIFFKKYASCYEKFG